VKYARFYNPIVTFLLRLGVPIGPQALLTVPGRNSGLLRTTPVALSPHGTGWLLVSVYGQVDWVKNLRAAGEAVVTKRRRRLQVTSQELTADQAGPIVRDLLASLSPIVRPVIGAYFVTDPSAPIEAWHEEARKHPVFILTPA
jgi:deazaflavin-dependent oxidoreductase (nitroreductase family)